MTPRRVAALLGGVALIVVGRFLGGYGGAGVIGAGIGLGAVGIGRREPHLFRRRPRATPDGEVHEELPEEW